MHALEGRTPDDIGWMGRFSFFVSAVAVIVVPFHYLRSFVLLNSSRHRSNHQMYVVHGAMLVEVCVCVCG